MDSSIFIPQFLENLAIAERLQRLLGLYFQADTAAAEWLEHFPYRCPPGCGACCSTFQPEVLQVEAELLAAYIINARSGLLHLLAFPDEATARSGDACLFYSESYVGSCSVYPARPLICRLFGTSAVRSKSGEIVYRLCAHIQSAEKRTFTELDLREVCPTPPPLMQNYGIPLDTGTSAIKSPIHTAAAKAYRSIRLLAKLSGYVLPTPEAPPDNHSFTGGLRRRKRA